MHELTAEFVESTQDNFRVWGLGNKVLYDLCTNYPDHKDDNVIIAKTWLIGRAYAAALERRRVVDDKGDAFYVTKLAPRIRDSEIDDWFGALRADGSGTGDLHIKTHKNLIDLLRGITGHAKRSFASKYLHFHFPELFFIYDSRAAHGLTKVMKALGEKPSRYRYRHDANINFDKEYADFSVCCDFAGKALSEKVGRKLTKREIDNVLLAIADLDS